MATTQYIKSVLEQSGHMGLKVTDCPSCQEYAEHEEVSSQVRTMEGLSDEPHWRCKSCGEYHTADDF